MARPPSQAPATLADLPAGTLARIVGTTGASDLQVRLWEMGLTPGTAVRVLKRAPLGDPLELVVRGYHLSLRAKEARGVAVAPLGEPEEAA
ncbi:MAG: ferrous iron transport protein A [Deltaproteobacteria bacterium]|nr:MAG: ferrous iron transport protein A [Deltaproteobacteria bacterium]